MYKHIFFDLDHTLWDYERNSKETLIALYQKHKLEKDVPNISSDVFLTWYLDITHSLWKLYNQHQISQEELRKIRLDRLFEKLEKKVAYEKLHRISEEYILLCPQKPHLMPFAKEALEYLQEKSYNLHIITNGFTAIQDTKIKSSRIEHFFQEVITSQTFELRKPNPKIFEYTLEKIKTQKEACIMIGDNLETDIQGAKNARIDHIFYNPKKELYQAKVQKKIHCLSELKEFF